jgi:hypothetical protein
MLKFDIEHYVTDAEIIVDPKLPNQMITRFQLVDQLPSGPQRNGKYVHLTLTSAQATRLLGTLQAWHQRTGLPNPLIPEGIVVPPAKDRN